jgi:signal transduction histidine kinase
MKSIRVILIDDDPVSLAKLTAILTSARYEVSSCDAFPVASRLIKAVKGRAVVLCPLQVDSGSGLAFMEETLKLHASLPVILFSPKPSVNDLSAALRGGAHDFLRKPVSSQALLDSVARATRRLDVSLEGESQDREARAEAAALRAELKNLRSQCAFKGFMISMAAHDFRSVLTVLDGYQQIIRQNCDKSCRNELPVRMLEQTGRTIFRLQSMANTLFDVEAAEKGELRVSAVPFDFDTLLKECAEFYRPYAAQKRVDLDVDVPLPAMRALGDPARVLQIFDNILYNAVKYTPGNGTIRIGGDRRDKKYVTATIRDTGSGLPKSMVKELRGDTPVSVRKDSDARIGMGLHICRRLVSAQNGLFDLMSEPGVGTTVSISLPVAE